MIIKIAGMVITVAAAWTYGYYMAEYTKKRMETLEQFKRAFILFADETLYTGAMLCEVFKNTAERTEGLAARVFGEAAAKFREKAAEGAYIIWEESLKNSVKNSFLTEEDINSLIMFGKSLGFSDRRCQVSNVNLAVEYIDNKLYELRKKYIKEAKLFRSLGVLTGLLAAVVIF